MHYHPVLINMQEFADILMKNKVKVNSILEIGSLDGADADYLSKRFHTNDTKIFEAVPEYAEKIADKYPKYSVYNQAVSDTVGETHFHIAREGNKGVSSMLSREDGRHYEQIKVESTRIDEVFDRSFDVVKVDVEGACFEVLEGFGGLLKKCKAFHLECEHIQVWGGQKTYRDVEEKMIESGFILASIKAAWPQTDSVWIRRDQYMSDWWK